MIIISDNHESLATWCRAIESRKESAFLWLTSHTCKAFSLCSGWIWFVISSTCAWLLFVIFVKEKCAMNMPAKTMVHTCRQKILKPRSAQISERSMRPELISRSFLHPHILHQWQFLDPLSESEKPCQCVSNADRKVFANPESFSEKFIIGWRISGYFAIQNIQIICKVSGWTGNFPDNLKSVRII